ncbi:hypothetical protein V6N13_032845 [Hibiscus sabdariffa]|uniref:Golgi SNAP receptor complex member 1 n=1 Tax=Hibiscus sabdariffa TaxID=183260 RepID=A0ABR2FBZ2_9ROSI
MEVPISWDALRKQARKLEAQLDEQMNSYRKLVSNKVSTKNDSEENDIESGVDRLLKQLQQVNIKMQDWVSSGGSEMVSHTLTRHQEILQDLTQEFYRLRSSLRAKQEHASLLEDFREFDRTRSGLEEGVDSTEQALIKERAAISRNTGHMDNPSSNSKSDFVFNKEEKVYGYHNSFSGCICMHISHLHLLVEQVTMFHPRLGAAHRAKKGVLAYVVS